MKNKAFYPTLFGMFAATYLSAQTVSNKIDSANSNVIKTNVAATNAANTVTATRNTLDYVTGSIGGFFKKKTKDPKRDSTTTTPSTASVVTINITGIDHDNLVTLRDSIEIITGVVKITKKYDPNASNITVYYTGKADLWELVPRHLQKMFVVKNEDDGLVNLEMKK